ncbi:uncharacterized protein N7483_010686 [Penicillium malachiteum]|uniref:uncharacterized protein n=1 Tax=Penicillium malachiteum TaxID=1324776 RepID=UPI002548BFB6|nr:uncharacterized protein N7483_010686 [Penicillium malachiteum]KAJ5713505.1 hypothetical protein N7483_010686 [Penicillium malachiteum]
MDNNDPLLSELCSICHVNPPKYRCPRCSTRTCSLPCTRRHKLWSQCSGIRDPAAYLKRSELMNESSLDRDFNFITGIERSLERADRDAENRGIDLARGQVQAQDGDGGDSQDFGAAAGRKRKHPQQGLVKGEAGFLRGAETGAVTVIRAPRGMSRNKENNSRWHPKHKCLSWSVEWVLTSGEKIIRNCLENCPIADAYDRAFPLAKQEKPNSEPLKDDEQNQSETAIVQDSTDAATSDAAVASNPSEPTAQPEQPSSRNDAEISTETEKLTEEDKPQDLTIGPHRELYFYLHRPRTRTNKPVLVPLAPLATLAAVLRERTVLEFPTIHVLADSPEKLLEQKDTSSFILEEEYVRTLDPEEAAGKNSETDSEDIDNGALGLEGSSIDLENVDEQKVLEVLKQDLFEPES